jgi:ATP-dependent RNA helicase DeaD
LTSLPIPAPLAKALAERGYADLTPVQSAVLAPEAAERDLLVSAQTGSGKTVAFGIGIGSTLLMDEFKLDRAADPLALIIAPTRELAMQVQRELEWLYAPAGGRVIACVGGMDPRRERRLLDSGAHIVVGTPGRLKDHIERKALLLGDVRAVVLDEADEMLDLGFRDDIEFILETTPETRRTLLFSATLPKAIVALASKFQKDAYRIASASGDRGHADIEYRALRTQPRETEHAIVNVLRQVDSPASLVFCNTRDGVRHLQAILVERGFSAVYLSGELSQNERNQALQALRDGRARICVATDVAARGIDLPNLGLVIHADLPLNAEILQHRSGRTGRAGRKGVSVLVVPHSRRRKAERLIMDAKIKPVWMDPPSADDIRALDRQRFLDDPLLTEEVTDEDRAMAEVLLTSKTPNDIAAILAKLYRSRLPEPEELSGPELMHAPRGDRNFDDKRSRDRDDRGARQRPERQDRPDRQDRPERSERQERSERFERAPEPLKEASDSVIFRMDVGRRQKADPKWLLPMICRRGNVSRQEIGTIRILDEVTEFEIKREAAEHFALHARKKDGEDIIIAPASEAPAPRDRDDFRKPYPKKAPKKLFSEKPDFSVKPRAERPYADRPAGGEKQDYGDRAPYGAKPKFSEKPDFSAKPRAERPHADRPAGGDKQDYGDRPPHGAKPKFSEKPDFAKKPDFKGKSDFTGKPGKSFSKSPKTHARTGFAHRKGPKP